MLEILARVDDRIQAHFDKVLDGLAPSGLADAMRHAVRGGKRVRAMLVLESARLHGIGAERAIWPAAAIEAMHAYSLVHDDLPCMDDDLVRRGLPTVHAKWDEATAVLAGDALQSLAFELAAHRDGAETPAARAELAFELARAAGAAGMALGQSRDMAAEASAAQPDPDDVAELQALKTGALIEWAAAAGPRMAHADSSALRAYAAALGRAFQIQDDVIDVAGDAQSAGKAVGKDMAAGKATFVSALGLEPARQRASELAEEACAALAPYGNEAESLRELARFAILRSA